MDSRTKGGLKRGGAAAATGEMSRAEQCRLAAEARGFLLRRFYGRLREKAAAPASWHAMTPTPWVPAIRPALLG
jgi:hypothetical protein